MTWWEILGASLVYASCGLVCARLVAGHLAYSFAANTYSVRTYGSKHLKAPDGEQWFGASVAGALAGMVWPLTFIVWRIHSGIGRWAIGAEAQNIRRQQAERIAELEREAGFR